MSKQNTVSDIAALLKDLDVEHAFGITGSGISLDLITALDRVGIRYFPVFHEAAAAIMAGVSFRLKRTPDISISIKGPGLTNMLPGIAHNRFENTYSISISESYASNAPSFRLHKKLDHRKLGSAIVKKHLDIGLGMETLEAEFNSAKTNIPGPVHLDLNFDGESDSHCFDEEGATVADEESGTLESLLNALQKADRPVIILGQGCVYDTNSAGFDALRIPIFTTAAAKGLVDEISAFSAGVYTGAGGELSPESFILNDATLIVGIGLREDELLGFPDWGKEFWVLDSVVGRKTFWDSTKVVVAGEGEFQPAINQVKSQLSGLNWGQEQIQESSDRLLNHLGRSGTKLPHDYFVVLNELSYDYIQVCDTGSFCTIAEHVWSSGPNRPFLGASIGRYMGVSIPSAIAASIVGNGSPVICAVGDGGIGMYLSELQLAVSEKLPLCVILMTDGGYGSIRGVAGPNKCEKAIDFPESNWGAYLEMVGLRSHDVVSPEELGEVMEKWQCDCPIFITIRFPKCEYQNMTEKVR